MSHEFRLRLPNGLEIQIAGDRDFVAGAYGDVKAGAMRLFEREADTAKPASAAAVAELPAPPAPAAPGAGDLRLLEDPVAHKPPKSAEEREEYYDTLLRFQEHCAASGRPFQVGMRQAIAAAMGEPATEPPAKKDKRPVSRGGKPGRRSWTPEQREKFRQSIAARRGKPKADAGGGLGEVRRRSRTDGGTATLNPNVIGGGSRLPQPSDRPTPRHAAAGLED